MDTETRIDLVKEEKETSDQTVILQQFPHQVGGHNCILMYDPFTVCKLLTILELSFYKEIPHSLEPFLPRYLGVINVLLENDVEGKAIFRAYRLSSDEIDHQIMTQVDTDEEIKVNFAKANSHVNNGPSKIQSEGPISPCNSKYYRKQVKVMNNDESKLFILLENVVQPFRCPCILDLKIGTWNQKLNILKSRSEDEYNKVSTIRLGVRLGGMQTYNVTDKKFSYFDKYFGKTLDLVGLKRMLYQYFDNGITFQHDIYNQMLKKLQLLRKRIALEDCFRFRFRGCSILLIYEGYCNDNINGNTNVDARLIDFSHTISNKLNYNPNQQLNGELIGPDNDTLKGLDNLLTFFMELSPSPQIS
ncbi:uncharacterized protein TRIADDRAFT_55021 [Trichoplax adhaerens]|uniref:Kinase n=1 Tax=Trichoplax adhaerens TaxID=10228 RepID=B3RQK4_TRIAD|nr:hypothetical protein TRIADDRAFT_55021 [Trichoplax adhaerens]EDV26711.1 hypothetical protein TRIADDRAFT_55021 [Trichoplax adhaerens]|eukprot:XP_002110707.1 hypothetical protein TRIADDRAFT_55021 [Trichoplax adhaerens]